MTERPDDREDDVDTDDRLANARPTGGDSGRDEGEGDEGAGATTGTGESEDFVRRAQGQDLGYAEETGAEVRAEARRGPR